MGRVCKEESAMIWLEKRGWIQSSKNCKSELKQKLPTQEVWIMALKWALLIYVVVVETRNFKGFAKDDKIEIILKSHLESDLLLFTVWTPK